MDAPTRLMHAIAERAYKSALDSGYSLFFDFDDLAAEVGATEVETRQAVRALLDDYYLHEDQPGCAKATPHLFWKYEKSNRAAAYQQNLVRRHILREASSAGDNGGYAEYSITRNEDEPYGQNELFIAANVLDYLGLVQGDGQNFNNHFHVKITSRGYEVARDERLQRHLLPVIPSEDDDAHLAIAPDVLKDVIVTCEQLLDARGWKQARVELERGDIQFRDGDWVNALREYYAAAESALKYVLDDDSVEYGETNALRKLSGQAAKEGLIPANYQALFGFTDSIRSPRSHGRGPAADTVAEVEVGQAEALLIANDVRSLLIYLGQRPALPAAAAPATTAASSP